MPVFLTHAEYDAVYFDRNTATPEQIAAATAASAMAGYGKYTRWVRGDADNPNDTGEFRSEMARRLNFNSRFNNKTVLEVGCAKGFIVQDLRNMLDSNNNPAGIEAYGIDVSQYCYDQADPSIQGNDPTSGEPIFRVGDARTILETFPRNKFDWLFSMRFFECLPDSEIQPTIDAMDFCSRNMVHFISLVEDANFYNVKTQVEWEAYDWGVQTTLIFDRRPMPV